GVFIETVRSPDRFIAALDRAAAQGKPVVALKVRRTERTSRAVTTHTGGIAGEPGFVFRTSACPSRDRGAGPRRVHRDAGSLSGCETPGRAPDWGHYVVR